MRNSDPWVRIVFVHRLNSDFHSIFTLLATGLNFQNGPNFGVPSDPTFWFRWIFISWQSVLTTSHWICANCKNSSVSFVMKYCPTSTVVRNPASVQNLINLSCCDNFSIRSLYLCNRNFLSSGSSFKGMFVLITFGTNDGLDSPLTTGPPVQSWQDSYSSHISATAP